MSKQKEGFPYEMWHEARKQERLLRSMMVDHRRRAERRREYYEKTKGDPAQFLQVHGRPMKIHVDPVIAAAADSPATMMPWQGQPDVLIDRFDVRAHLDYIPPRTRKEDSGSSDDSDKEEAWEERQASYERYRILVQNEFTGVPEEKFLHQIHLEEQFGPVQKVGEEDKKKQLAPKKAAIGFTYDDSTPSASTLSTVFNANVVPPEATEDDESDSDIDLDLTIAVDKLTTDQMHEVNRCARAFGLGKNDFMSFLTRDLDEQEYLRIAKEEEQERAMYSGRKARKERRAFREQKLQALMTNRCLSPPSYAARESPTYGQYRRADSGSRSRSPSPVDGGIKFITSFGDEDDSDAGAKLKGNSRSPIKNRETADRKQSSKGKLLRPNAASREATKSHNRHSRSRSTERRGRSSPSYKHRNDKKAEYRRRSRSRPSRSRSPSGSRSRRRRSRSPSNSRRRRSRSRSPRKRNASRSQSRDRYRRRRSSSSSSSTSSSSSRSSPQRRTRSTTSSSSSSSRSPRPSTSTRQPSPLPEPAQPPPPPVRKYYGRKDSDSELSLSDDDTSQKKPATPPTSTKSSPSMSGSSGRSAGATKGGLTPAERLKRKMQAALNKTYKADKKAEKERLQKVEQERMNREEEMRELALRLRRKERMRRHAARGDSDYSSRSSRSRSPSPP